MKKNGRVSIFVHLEGFLVGLCCLIGGDQFYILVSQTDASVKTQYNMVISISIVTLMVVFVLDHIIDKSLSNLFHLAHFFLLLVTIIFSFYKTRSKTVITIYNIFLAHVLTFFIAQTCINYSHYKNLMQTFLLGLLSSRLLPTFAWLTIKKSTLDTQTVLDSLSTRLNIIRVLICLLSLVLKLLNGTFYLSFGGSPIMSHYLKYYEPMSEIWNVFLKNWICCLPIFSLILSLILFISFSVPLYRPLTAKLHFDYSSQLISSLSITEIIFHLAGSLFGILYPASITTNSENFHIVNIAMYTVYTVIITFLSYIGQYFTHRFIQTIVIISSFSLGYVWSYCLMIVYKMFLAKTCVYEEGYKPCCGDKINNECYCRLRDLVRDLNQANKDGKICTVNYLSGIAYINNSRVILFPTVKCRYLNRFCCSESYETFGLIKESFIYSSTGPNAILLIYNNGEEINGECLKSLCSNGVCTTTCSGNCLNLVEVYKLDTITTSTCDNCQLTVRLEAKKTKCGPDLCGSSGSLGGCNCSCSGGKNCCICVKCCSKCQAKCEKCIRLCCCETCKFRKIGFNATRIFICFKAKDCCCIRELTTNRSPSFDQKIHKQNLFNITDIHISDCCHVDLQIDLHCTMQNNFFRLTPIDYKNKSSNPFTLRFVRKHTKCCSPTSSTTNCCCVDLVVDRLCLKFKPEPSKVEGAQNQGKKGEKPKTPHEIQVEEMEDCIYSCDCPKTPPKCPCECCKQCGEGKECCCCMTFKVDISQTTSYFKKIEPLRVKLISGIMILFMISLLLSFSIVTSIKDKRINYYELMPIRSFKPIKQKIKKEKLNTIPEISKRLRTIADEYTSKDLAIKDKSDEVNKIFDLFQSALSVESFNSMKGYVMSQSGKFMSIPVFAQKQLGLELVKWCFCIGVVEAYIDLMFLLIQTYFVRWEYVWQREYYNYKKLITANFKGVTQKSKFALSLLSEIDIRQETQLLITRDRTSSWNDANDELERYMKIYDKEMELDTSLPSRMDLRLSYMLDRWKHRIDSIQFWTTEQTNVFDWKPFIKEYPNICNWYRSFLPYIERASVDITIQSKEMIKISDAFTKFKIK